MKVKKLCMKAVSIAVAIVIFASPALAAGAGSTLYTSSYSITNELDFVNTVSSNSSGQQEGYYFEYTPGGAITAIVASGSTVYGKNTISTVADQLISEGYNVIGGVNADFFSSVTGIPLGALVENGKLLTVGDTRNVVGFNEDGSAFYSEEPVFEIVLTNNGISEEEYDSEEDESLSDDEEENEESTNAGEVVTVQYYNQQRGDYGLYLLSSDYYSNNQASMEGKDVLFKIIDGDNSSITPSCTVQLEVICLYEGNTPTEIPEGYLLLTANSKCPYYADMDKFAVGDQVTLTISCSDSRIAEAAYVTGCGDILAKDGEITDSSDWDSALSGKNPRTAVGIKADGTVVIYAADGRRSDAVGLTMTALAEELISQGCETVINMDGGGSTSCIFREPGDDTYTVVNTPSDGSLRSCSTFIFIVSSDSGNGEAEDLYLDPNDPVVLAGSTVTFSGIKATDSGYYPAEVPEDTECTAVYGEMSGLTYSAPESACEDVITINSDDGAYGESIVTVVDNISTIYVTEASSSASISSLEVYVDNVVELAVSVPSYYGQTVYCSADAFTYEVTGDIGTISDTGEFSATQEGTGSIIISYGTVSVTIPVTVSIYSRFEDVPPSFWAREYIEALAEMGVINGVSDTLFEPDSNITREDFCTMLSRYLGIDTEQYSSLEVPFDDTDSISSYAVDHVKALYALGYVQGSENSGVITFNPQNYITRAEICTILGRILEGDSITVEFSDADDIPEWAEDGVGKMTALGIVNGYTDGTFKPLNNATRAEVATIIYKISNIA